MKEKEHNDKIKDFIIFARAPAPQQRFFDKGETPAEIMMAYKIGANVDIINEIYDAKFKPSLPNKADGKPSKKAQVAEHMYSRFFSVICGGVNRQVAIQEAYNAFSSFVPLNSDMIDAYNKLKANITIEPDMINMEDYNIFAGDVKNSFESDYMQKHRAKAEIKSLVPTALEVEVFMASCSQQKQLLKVSEAESCEF